MGGEKIKCNICQSELAPDQVQTFTILKEEYNLCGWDALRVKQYIDYNMAHSAINIFWGAGHICWSSWYSIRDYLRKFGIKEILELGIGLSSECFVNEGIKVIGFDVWPEHVKLYQDHLALKNDAVFHWYPDHSIPPVKELYPGRKWDFVFVDGPQERSREVRLAMELSNKYIYLHDPNLGEESFFPNDEWIQEGKDSKLYVKRA
jgi:hypothetical protein